MIGECMQRAINMTVPHWGSPSANLSTPAVMGNSTGAGEIVSSILATDLNGIEPNTLKFSAACSGIAAVVPFETTNTTTAVVISVTSITNTNPDRTITVYMESCDGAVSLNTSRPGIFVIKGPSAAVAVERWDGSTTNKTKDCPGDSFVAWTSATLENFCKVSTSIAECKSVAAPGAKTTTNAPAATSSATTNAKLSHMVATAFAMVATLAVVLA